MSDLLDAARDGARSAIRRLGQPRVPGSVADGVVVEHVVVTRSLGDYLSDLAPSGCRFVFEDDDGRPVEPGLPTLPEHRCSV